MNASTDPLIKELSSPVEFSTGEPYSSIWWARESSAYARMDKVLVVRTCEVAVAYVYRSAASLVKDVPSPPCGQCSTGNHYAHQQVCCVRYVIPFSFLSFNRCAHSSGMKVCACRSSLARGYHPRPMAMTAYQSHLPASGSVSFASRSIERFVILHNIMFASVLVSLASRMLFRYLRVVRSFCPSLVPPSTSLGGTGGAPPTPPTLLRNQRPRRRPRAASHSTARTTRG